MDWIKIESDLEKPRPALHIPLPRQRTFGPSGFGNESGVTARGFRWVYTLSNFLMEMLKFMPRAEAEQYLTGSPTESSDKEFGSYLTEEGANLTDFYGLGWEDRKFELDNLSIRDYYGLTHRVLEGGQFWGIKDALGLANIEDQGASEFDHMSKVDQLVEVIDGQSWANVAFKDDGIIGWDPDFNGAGSTDLGTEEDPDYYTEADKTLVVNAPGPNNYSKNYSPFNLYSLNPATYIKAMEFNKRYSGTDQDLDNQDNWLSQYTDETAGINPVDYMDLFREARLWLAGKVNEAGTITEDRTSNVWDDNNEIGRPANKMNYYELAMTRKGTFSNLMNFDPATGAVGSGYSGNYFKEQYLGPIIEALKSNSRLDTKVKTQWDKVQFNATKLIDGIKSLHPENWTVEGPNTTSFKFKNYNNYGSGGNFFDHIIYNPTSGAFMHSTRGVLDTDGNPYDNRYLSADEIQLIVDTLVEGRKRFFTPAGDAGDKTYRYVYEDITEPSGGITKSRKTMYLSVLMMESRRRIDTGLSEFVGPHKALWDDRSMINRIRGYYDTAEDAEGKNWRGRESGGLNRTLLSIFYKSQHSFTNRIDTFFTPYAQVDRVTENNLSLISFNALNERSGYGYDFSTNSVGAWSYLNWQTQGVNGINGLVATNGGYMYVDISRYGGMGLETEQHLFDLIKVYNYGGDVDSQEVKRDYDYGIIKYLYNNSNARPIYGTSTDRDAGGGNPRHFFIKKQNAAGTNYYFQDAYLYDYGTNSGFILNFKNMLNQTTERTKNVQATSSLITTTVDPTIALDNFISAHPDWHFSAPVITPNPNNDGEGPGSTFTDTWTTTITINPARTLNPTTEAANITALKACFNGDADSQINSLISASFGAGSETIKQYINGQEIYQVGQEGQLKDPDDLNQYFIKIGDTYYPLTSSVADNTGMKINVGGDLKMTGATVHYKNGTGITDLTVFNDIGVKEYYDSGNPDPIFNDHFHDPLYFEYKRQSVTGIQIGGSGLAVKSGKDRDRMGGFVNYLYQNTYNGVSFDANLDFGTTGGYSSTNPDKGIKVMVSSQAFTGGTLDPTKVYNFSDLDLNYKAGITSTIGNADLNFFKEFSLQYADESTSVVANQTTFDLTGDDITINGTDYSRIDIYEALSRGGAYGSTQYLLERTPLTAKVNPALVTATSGDPLYEDYRKIGLTGNFISKLKDIFTGNISNLPTGTTRRYSYGDLVARFLNLFTNIPTSGLITLTDANQFSIYDSSWATQPVNNTDTMKIWQALEAAGWITIKSTYASGRVKDIVVADQNQTDGYYIERVAAALGLDIGQEDDRKKAREISGRMLSLFSEATESGGNFSLNLANRNYLFTSDPGDVQSERRIWDALRTSGVISVAGYHDTSSPAQPLTNAITISSPVLAEPTATSSSITLEAAAPITDLETYCAASGGKFTYTYNALAVPPSYNLTINGPMTDEERIALRGFFAGQTAQETAIDDWFLDSSLENYCNASAGKFTFAFDSGTHQYTLSINGQMTATERDDLLKYFVGQPAELAAINNWFLNCSLENYCNASAGRFTYTYDAGAVPPAYSLTIHGQMTDAERIAVRGYFAGQPAEQAAIDSWFTASSNSRLSSITINKTSTTTAGVNVSPVPTMKLLKKYDDYLAGLPNLSGDTQTRASQLREARRIILNGLLDNWNQFKPAGTGLTALTTLSPEDETSLNGLVWSDILARLKTNGVLNEVTGPNDLEILDAPAVSGLRNIVTDTLSLKATIRSNMDTSLDSPPGYSGYYFSMPAFDWTWQAGFYGVILPKMFNERNNPVASTFKNDLTGPEGDACWGGWLVDRNIWSGMYTRGWMEPELTERGGRGNPRNEREISEARTALTSIAADPLNHVPPADRAAWVTYFMNNFVVFQTDNNTYFSYQQFPRYDWLNGGEDDERTSGQESVSSWDRTSGNYVSTLHGSRNMNADAGHYRYTIGQTPRVRTVNDNYNQFSYHSLSAFVPDELNSVISGTNINISPLRPPVWYTGDYNTWMNALNGVPGAGYTAYDPLLYEYSAPKSILITSGTAAKTAIQSYITNYNSTHVTPIAVNYAGGTAPMTLTFSAAITYQTFADIYYKLDTPAERENSWRPFYNSLYIPKPTGYQKNIDDNGDGWDTVWNAAHTGVVSSTRHAGATPSIPNTALLGTLRDMWNLCHPVVEGQPNEQLPTGPITGAAIDTTFSKLFKLVDYDWPSNFVLYLNKMNSQFVSNLFAIMQFNKREAKRYSREYDAWSDKRDWKYMEEAAGERRMAAMRDNDRRVLAKMLAKSRAIAAMGKRKSVDKSNNKRRQDNK